MVHLRIPLLWTRKTQKQARISGVFLSLSCVCSGPPSCLETREFERGLEYLGVLLCSVTAPVGQLSPAGPWTCFSFKKGQYRPSIGPPAAQRRPVGCPLQDTGVGIRYSFISYSFHKTFSPQGISLPLFAERKMAVACVSTYLSSRNNCPANKRG